MKLIRVLVPETEGNWIYNKIDKTITDKTDLGVFATKNDFEEITEEQKQEIESKQNEENTKE